MTPVEEDAPMRIASLTLLTALVVFAPPTFGEHPKEHGEKATLTGCLAAGKEAGTFALEQAKSESGESLGTVTLGNVPADLKLGGHVGHHVEMKGDLSGKQLAPTAMKHLAASCPAPSPE
jgi:hypothetical protein